MSEVHAIALGILIAILLLSAVGFIQLLLLPFDIAAKVMFGAADAILKARENERICRAQHEAKLRRLKND